MILLTLDTSVRRTGYAVGPLDGVPVFGSYSSPKFPDKAIGKMLAAYEAWFIAMLEEHQPGAVGIEAPLLPKFAANITVRRKLFGLVDTTDKVCAQRGITCYEVANQKIKLHVTGFGNAKKHHVVDAVRAMGLDARNDDEADAAALWLYSVSWFDRIHKTEHAQKWFMRRGDAEAV